jgi:hypothetical protein
VTIRRGEPWGEPTQSPPGLHIVNTDAELRQWVIRHRAAGEPVPPVGLAGGDLARSIGGGHPERFPGIVTRAPVDLLRVTSGDQVTWAAAHLVGFTAWWHGEAFLAMNAQYRGRWDVAPRSHPNDGKVDVVQIDPAMPWRQRLAASKRARTGTHLPHPMLQARQVAAVELRLGRRLPLWADGQRWIVTDHVDVTVEPDALDVYV